MILELKENTKWFNEGHVLILSEAENMEASLHKKL